MKKILIFIGITALTLIGAHGWNSYHWRSDRLNPAVKDRTSDTLYDVPAEVAEWSGLETPIQPAMAGRKGNITIKESSNIFWLGMARIFIDDEGHITRGEVQLNTRLLAGYGPAAAEHVLCQELGHVLGLDHQRDASDSCMNDQLKLGDATSPNSHDVEELWAIYDHADVIEDNGGGGKKCENPPCNDRGRWVTVDIFPVPEE
jgi:hypothetical protein